MTMLLSRFAGLLLVPGSVLLLSACSGITDPPEIVQLQGELDPADDVAEPITGSVAMVIAERQTQIGIGVDGAVEGRRFGWRVRNGSCPGSGDRIGPASGFPPIEIDEDGTGQAETILFRRIDASATYAAEVLTETDGTGSVLACGVFVAAD